MGGMSSPKTPREALDAAIAKAGGTRSDLMRALNRRDWQIKSSSVILQWQLNGVPAKYCPDIEALTGIPCEQLCPDVRWGLVRDRRGNRRKEARA